MPVTKVVEDRSKKRKNKSNDKPHQPERPKRVIDNLPRQPDRFRRAKSKHRNYQDSSLLFTFDHYILRSSWAQMALISSLVVIVLSVGMIIVTDWKKSRSVITPLDLPMIVPNSPDSGQLGDLDWGTYRPGHYFGVRHRDPSSPLIGLVWFIQDGQMPRFHHLCDPNDGVLSFNWIEHDGRNYAIEQIVDAWHIINVAFVKSADGWNVRVSAFSKNQTVKTPPISIMLYVYYPDATTTSSLTALKHQSSVYGIQGTHPPTLGDKQSGGKHQFSFRPAGTKQRRLQVSHLETYIANETSIMGALFEGLAINGQTKLITLTGQPHSDRQSAGSTNALFFEVTAQADTSVPTGSTIEQLANEQAAILDLTFSRSSSSPSSGFNASLLADLSQRFHGRFAKRLPMDEKQFTNRQVKLSKIALSNLLGGIGFFHGSSLIKSKPVGLFNLFFGPSTQQQQQQPSTNWAAPLLTTTPSRALFPRGFLWDEGFHDLILVRWDPELAMQVVGYWLDLINADGWIAREQILGLEARSRVPSEFVIQSPDVANPPTFALVVEALMDRLPQFTPSEASHFRKWALLTFPRLHVWYQWFNETQSGPELGTYRWRGRNPEERHQLNPLTLSSGLDDYPRASHPSNAERHLDLRCWMAHFARVMGRFASLIAQYRQASDDGANSSTDRVKQLSSDRSLAAAYTSWANQLTDSSSLDAAHWSESTRRYADYGLHSDDVQLKQPATEPGVEPGKPVRVTNSPAKLQLVTSQFGYVNLFPLLLRLIPPDSPHLPGILDDLSNTQLLWTDFGLRSLSPSSSNFYQARNTPNDPPYWRGAIWMPINYLAVSSLRFYARHQSAPSEVASKASQLAERLSSNLARTVLGQLEQTGYLWEQYNDVSGAGQRGRPFSGWTSLVVLAMSPPGDE